MKKLSFLFIALFTISQAANATDYYWVYGGVNTNWTTLGNWRTVSFSGSVATSLPTSSDNVFLGNGSTAATVVVNASDTINNLTIQGSGAIVINSSNGAALHVWGNLTSTNSSNAGGGSTGHLIFDGSGTQTITGNATAGTGKLTRVTIAKNSTDSLKLFNTVSFVSTVKLTYTSGIVDAGTSTVHFGGGNTVEGSFALYHVDVFGSGASVVVTDSLDVKGNLKFYGTGIWGVNTGTVNLYGNLDCQATNASGGGSAVVTFKGSANQSYRFSVGRFTKWKVDKSGGTVSPASGTTLLNLLFFELTGGTFVAPSGTFTLGNTTIANNVTNQRFTHSGGTFDANGGTVQFISQGSNNRTTVNGIPSTLFHSVIVNCIQYGQSSANDVSPATGDSIHLSGTLNHTNGDVNGVWTVAGNLNIGSSAGSNNNNPYAPLSTGQICMVGSANATYSGASTGRTGSLVIKKSGGATVTPDSGAFQLNVYTFRLESGSFTAPTGTLSVGCTVAWGLNTSQMYTQTGGTFTHNGGTVEFVQSGYTFAGIVDVLPSTVFNHVQAHCYAYGTSSYNAVGPATGDSMRLDGNLVHSSGVIDGVWYVKGNLVLGSPYQDNGAVVHLTGPGNANYTSLGTTARTCKLVVEKAGNATVTPDSITTYLTAVNLKLVSGSFVAPTGALSLGAGSDVKILEHVGGAFAANGGTLRVNPSYNTAIQNTYQLDMLPQTLLHHLQIVASNYQVVIKGGTGDSVRVDGDLTMTYGNLNTNVVLVSGNVSATGASIGVTAPLIFVGTANQTLDATGMTGIFNGNVTVNKPSGTLTLLSALTLDATSQSLTLMRGDVVTTATNLLTLGDNVTVSGASDSSHVSGPVKKVGNDAFTFPTGNGMYYHPASITAPSVTSDAFTGEYVNTAYNPSQLDTSLTYANDCAHWNLDRTAGTSNVNVRLDWNMNTCDVHYLSTIRIARFDLGLNVWKSIGVVTANGSASNGYIESNSTQSSFGKFAIGKRSTIVVADAGPDSLIDFADTLAIGAFPVTSGGTSPFTYTWSPAFGLSSVTTANPLASPSVTTTYVVTVVDADDASATDTVVISVNPHVSIIRDIAITLNDLDSAQLVRYNKANNNSHYSAIYFVKTESPMFVSDSGKVKLSLSFISCPDLYFRTEMAEYTDSTNMWWYGISPENQDSACAMAELVVLMHDGIFVGNLTLKHRSLELFDLGGGVHIMCETDMSLKSVLAECAAREDEETETEDHTDDPCVNTATKILVLFDQAADNESPDVVGVAQLSRAMLTIIWINSQVDNPVELVAVEPLEFTESNDIQSDVMALSNNATAQARRDFHDAEVVVLLTSSNYPGAYGIVRELGGDFDDAYAIVSVTYAASARQTFSHEVCHLYDARHDDDNTGQPYAHGYRFKVCHGWFLNFWDCTWYNTLMYTGVNTRIKRLSNPDLSYMGKPTGTATHNNARRVNEMRHHVADFYIENDFELVATISAPTFLPECETSGNAHAYVNCGTAPFTYQWAMSENGSTWFNFGTNSSNVTYGIPIPPYGEHYNSRLLRVTITDANNNVAVAVKTVKYRCDYHDNDAEPLELQRESTDDVSLGSVALYPNPTHNAFTLQFDSEDDGVQISLLDITGRTLEEIYNGTTRNGVNILDVQLAQHYSDGVYLVKVVTPKGTRTQKLMLQ